MEVLFVTPGMGDEAIIREALLDPDTTAADLLRAADLSPSEWQLQIKQGEKLVTLRSHDKLAEQVQAGEKVYAIPTHLVVSMAT